MPQSLVEYGILVLVNVFLAEAVIVYVLGVTEVSVEAFSSFSFFIKYVVISSVIALIIPYMEEFVRKYISISYEVKKRDDKE